MNKINIQNKPLLRTIKAAQPKWFSAENKRFFNDRSYYGVYGKETGKAYLLRSTYAWTDMFGQTPTLHYRIDEIDQETHKILSLIDDVFNSLDDAKRWLNSH